MGKVLTPAEVKIDILKNYQVDVDQLTDIILSRLKSCSPHTLKVTVLADGYSDFVINIVAAEFRKLKWTVTVKKLQGYNVTTEIVVEDLND